MMSGQLPQKGSVRQFESSRAGPVGGCIRLLTQKSQLPQPEEHTTAAGGELEDLLGADHARRANHIDPA